MQIVNCNGDKTVLNRKNNIYYFCRQTMTWQFLCPKWEEKSTNFLSKFFRIAKPKKVPETNVASTATPARSGFPGSGTNASLVRTWNFASIAKRNNSIRPTTWSGSQIKVLQNKLEKTWKHYLPLFFEWGWTARNSIARQKVE